MRKSIILIATLFLFLSCGNSPKDEIEKSSTNTSTESEPVPFSSRENQMAILTDLPRDGTRYEQQNDDGTITSYSVVQKVVETYLIGEMEKRVTIQAGSQGNMKEVNIYANKAINSIFKDGQLVGEIPEVKITIVLFTTPLEGDTSNPFFEYYISSPEKEGIAESKNFLNEIQKKSIHIEREVDLEQTAKWKVDFNKMILDSGVYNLLTYEDYQKLDKTKYINVPILENSNGEFNNSYIISVKDELRFSHKNYDWNENSRRLLKDTYSRIW